MFEVVKPMWTAVAEFHCFAELLVDTPYAIELGLPVLRSKVGEYFSSCKRHVCEIWKNQGRELLTAAQEKVSEEWRDWVVDTPDVEKIKRDLLGPGIAMAMATAQCEVTSFLQVIETNDIHIGFLFKARCNELYGDLDKVKQELALLVSTSWLSWDN